MTSPLRRRLGIFALFAGVALICAGVLVRAGQVLGLVPPIPYAGRIVTALGAMALSFGGALIRGEPLTKGLERRPTSLVVVLPALVLFAVMLLGAALFFGSNLEQPTSTARWIGSGAFLAVSLILFSALLRDLLARFGASASRRSSEAWASRPSTAGDPPRLPPPTRRRAD